MAVEAETHLSPEKEIAQNRKRTTEEPKARKIEHLEVKILEHIYHHLLAFSKWMWSAGNNPQFVIVIPCLVGLYGKCKK